MNDAKASKVVQSMRATFCDHFNMMHVKRLKVGASGDLTAETLALFYPFPTRIPIGRVI
jgi:hypothetical protein